MENLQKTFAVFSDESNMMPRENVVKALRSMGYIVEDEFCDSHGKSRLDLKDFIESVAEAEKSGLDRKKIEEAFAFYDPNDTGYIKASEFKKILSSGTDKLSESDINIIFETFPPNDQGLICYNLPISFIFDN